MTLLDRAYWSQRQQLAGFMRRLYRQQLTTTSGGNLSLRADAGHLLITASRTDKALLQAEDICLMSADGQSLDHCAAPSIEAGMHVAIYRHYPEVRAVVHAHPVTATAFSAAGRPINCRFIAEAYAVVGDPGFAPYARMGTADLAAALVQALDGRTCALMQNHGVLTTGATLLEAFDRLEVLEFAARTTLILETLGGGIELTAGELAELDCMMGRTPGGNR